MPTTTYATRRGQLEHYFDRTAVEAWKRLTSDAPVSGIRATVRAGRAAMRATLLSWLPNDLSGRALLDAGCGTGALSFEAADRGADVLAIDLAAQLVRIAAEQDAARGGKIRFHVGDMLDPALGEFDHVVAMDSLIHYAPDDVVRVLARLAPRVRHSILFTFAPRTPALRLMHAAGKLFPRGDRSPAIVPVAFPRLVEAIGREPALADFTPGRTHRVKAGFYISQALELVRR